MDYIVMTSLYNQKAYNQKVYDNEDNKLMLVHAISRTLSSLLGGLANATEKCMNYPNCMAPTVSTPTVSTPTVSTPAVQTGGLAITDIGTIGGNVIQTIERTVILAIKIIGIFSNTISPVLEEAVFGNLADKPWAEVAPQILRIINEKKEYLDKMSRDPEVQEALKEWAEAYATIGIQTTEAIRPSLNRMVDEALETLSETGKRAATGVINLGLNVGEGAIGEIPVAGGIIAIILALIRGLNQSFVAAAPALKFGIESAKTGYDTGMQVMGIIDKGKQQLDETTQKLQSITDKFKNIDINSIGSNTLQNVTNIGTELGKNVIANSPLSVMPKKLTDAVVDYNIAKLKNGVSLPKVPDFINRQQSGGAAAAANAKRIKKKIDRTTQRIKKTLSKFKYKLNKRTRKL